MKQGRHTAALLGAGTAVVVRWFSGWLNPTGDSIPAVALGLVVALCWVLVVHGFLGLGVDLPLVWPSSATYLFWVGIPSAIYVVVSAWGSHRIARGLREGHQKVTALSNSSVPVRQISSQS